MHVVRSTWQPRRIRIALEQIRDQSGDISRRFVFVIESNVPRAGCHVVKLLLSYVGAIVTGFALRGMRSCLSPLSRPWGRSAFFASIVTKVQELGEAPDAILIHGRRPDAAAGERNQTSLEIPVEPIEWAGRQLDFRSSHSRLEILYETRTPSLAPAV